jgi:hypothetical protein
LRDYKETDDPKQVQQEQDELQDRMIIYNEVIDTIRAILSIFKVRSEKRLEIKKINQHEAHELDGELQNL